jgi:hypothetical protein
MAKEPLVLSISSFLIAKGIKSASRGRGGTGGMKDLIAKARQSRL